MAGNNGEEKAAQPPSTGTVNALRLCKHGADLIILACQMFGVSIPVGKPLVVGNEKYEVEIREKRLVQPVGAMPRIFQK